MQEYPFCWDKQTAFENLDLAKKMCEAIFKIYPDAVIREVFHDPDNCIVHFNAWGGFGSDSVCIGSDGSWWQFLSGDLSLNELEELEKALKPICVEYHKKRIEIKVSRGLRQLFE